MIVFQRVRDAYGDNNSIASTEITTLKEMARAARAYRVTRAEVGLHDAHGITHYLLVLRLPILPLWMGIIIRREGRAWSRWTTRATILLPHDLRRHRANRERGDPSIQQVRR